jgi:excisionase family DNA binding protein
MMAGSNTPQERGRARSKREIPMQDPLMTVDEVAEFLGLSRQTIYRKVSEEALPCFKIFSAVRFNRQEILDWIAKQSKKTRR